jgi:hypothetical protein
MRNDLTDFRFRHLLGMLFVVKENEAAYPADIGAFGA